MTDARSIDVLRFWRDVEVCNIPTTPKRVKKDNLRVAHFRPGMPLPWQKNHERSLIDTEASEWRHAVFLGVTDARDWAKILLETVCPGSILSEDDRQQPSGSGWVAAFVVSSSGQMIADSYVPASFILGMRRLQKKETLEGLSVDIKAEVEAFKERCTQHTVPPLQKEKSPPALDTPDDTESEHISRIPKPIGWIELNRELEHALRTLSSSIPAQTLSVVIKSSLRRKRQPTEKSENDVDFLNSFYLNDLDRLINCAHNGQRFGKVLEQYLGAESAPKYRQDILAQPSAMTSSLSPRNLTNGRWPAPSKHHLMLAQQAAVGEIVNQLHASAGLIAVNGPPGTGKTTLLCDIVADVVVHRASMLSSLDKPWQAFGERTIVGGMTVFPLRPDIVGGSGIVVASNNNTAVENITKELPALAKIAQNEHPNAGYLREVANQVFIAAGIEMPAWGLVAAALGNSENRTKFINAFFRDNQEDVFQSGEPCDVKSFLEAASDDSVQKWQDAKQEFLDLFELVSNAKKNFSEIFAAIVACDELRIKEDNDKRAITKIDEILLALPTAWAARILDAEAAEKISHSNFERAVGKEQLVKLQAQGATDRLKAAERVILPLWDRCLNSLGIKTARYRNWNDSTRELRLQRLDASEMWRHSLEAMQHCKSEYANFKQQLQKINSDYQSQEQNLKAERYTLRKKLKRRGLLIQQYERQVEAFKATGITVPDREFFRLNVAERHLASVWVSPSFDFLRARLFLAALRLHEATLLACKGKAIANLRAFVKMLSRNNPEPIPETQREILWSILFFTVPVVSSTLASFDRLFAGLGRESLGWLLIDEAGQATPQSVLGALWRVKRAVIIGDPLQIEPVMTVPRALIAELRERYGVDARWSPASESAQTLADRTMSIGAWVGDAHVDTGVWTGLPLRAHRRCIDPMFSVANRIAYAGQMVQANKNQVPIECLLGDSAWFDVRGTSSGGQIVAEELQCLEQLIIELRANWPSFDGGKLASLFVISPFKKVAEECGAAFKHAGIYKEDWPIDWGTVHRFQGREADIVFIVLGSAPGRAGGGSRAWASSKPNLLNVAITRARQRIYIIGNHPDWSSCSQFDVLAAALSIQSGQRKNSNVN